MRLILASQSPRRLDLLKRIGIVPHAVIPADIDETPLKAELPAPYVARIAAAKAAAVAPSVAGAQEGEGALVLAADTTVAVGRRILAKPEDEADARRMLALLSGRRHNVFTAVTLVDSEGKARHRLSTTVVAFKRFSDAELDAYIASREWDGKAGAYGIQGRAEAYVRFLSGSYSNVVGLPLFETRALLESAGYPLG